jgi:hypothetical protein
LKKYCHLNQNSVGINKKGRLFSGAALEFQTIVRIEQSISFTESIRIGRDDFALILRAKSPDGWQGGGGLEEAD